MKKNFGIVLAIALGLSALLLTIAFQAGWVSANPFKATIQSTTPTIVSYQGHIWDGDTPYDGTGYFKFEIVTDIGELLWSNDGESPPLAAIELKVENGYFSVNLGDTSLPGMDVPLTADIFEKFASPYLAIYFSPDNHDFAGMPLQPIASVPYALVAEVAASAYTADNAINATNATNASYATNAGNASYATNAGNATNATNASYATNAGNADTLDTYHASSFQLRVTGTCPAGQAVKQVNSEGTVVCEPIPQPVTFTTNLVDTDGGTHNSITIGPDGLGLIVYNSGGSLRVAHCEDIACSTVTSSLLNSVSIDGEYASIAIGLDLLPLISYYDGPNAELRVAHCSNISCSSATITTLDGSGFNSGLFTSIAIGSDGLGLISYYDHTSTNLKVAHCSNTACSSASITEFVETNVGGKFTSLTIGTDGYGLISYQHTTTSSLKVLHCDNLLCNSGTRTVLDSGGFDGASSAITIGSDGLGLISYFDNTLNYLKVAHCSNLACTSFTNNVIATVISEITNPSIVIGSDGFGLISYGVMNVVPEVKDLKIVHCNDLACMRAYTYTLDATGSMGWYNDITIGMDGFALISYSDLTTSGLKVAHCSNLFCNPDY